jgi:hypothetical protein
MPGRSFGFPSSMTPAPATPAPAASAAAPVDWTQYEARFTDELAFMAEMGWHDRGACVSALLAAGGNVDAAVDRMLTLGALPTATEDVHASPAPPPPPPSSSSS